MMLVATVIFTWITITFLVVVYSLELRKQLQEEKLKDKSIHPWRRWNALRREIERMNEKSDEQN